jgi:RNA recognition motif-containing protein
MNILISNLGNRITSESLGIVFATYGEVRSARILNKESAVQAGSVALIEMPNEREAMNAIGRLNGSILDGQTIKVTMHSAQAHAGL